MEPVRALVAPVGRRELATAKTTHSLEQNSNVWVDFWPALTLWTARLGYLVQGQVVTQSSAQNPENAQVIKQHVRM